MITLISQDGLKAIATDRIEFFLIIDERNKLGKFKLFAKTRINSNTFFDYLSMFEDEDVEVVKKVLRFLVAGGVTAPHSGDKDKYLVVDLPDLYKCGMKAD